MLVGTALGAAAVNGLHAQGKTPGAYAILDISEILDPAAVPQIVAKAVPATKAAGGQYLAATEKIMALSGDSTKRLAMSGGLDLFFVCRSVNSLLRLTTMASDMVDRMGLQASPLYPGHGLRTFGFFSSSGSFPDVGRDPPSHLGFYLMKLKTAAKYERCGGEPVTWTGRIFCGVSFADRSK